ncbi:uncharacterized protein TNCV_574441 [Trichonephila clavipes]|nr:uncharacterized protein TNCV_574441 [Trichonephila clavipes]
MGWTKPHCSSFDGVHLTRYIGASKTVGGKGPGVRVDLVSPGWTLDEILRLEVRTNRYSPFRGSSSFIEVPRQIAETKAIINVINKKDSQCFMWSILAALYPNTSNPNKTSSYVPHLNKLNFDGISFPTPLNEQNRLFLSTIVISRIHRESRELKTFVANRVSKIHQLSSRDQWHHIASKQNPDDVLSRGLHPEELRDDSLWWHGPELLLQSAFSTTFIAEQTQRDDFDC